MDIQIEKEQKDLYEDVTEYQRVILSASLVDANSSLAEACFWCSDCPQQNDEFLELLLEARNALNGARKVWVSLSRQAKQRGLELRAACNPYGSEYVARKPERASKEVPEAVSNADNASNETNDALADIDSGLDDLLDRNVGTKKEPRTSGGYDDVFDPVE